MRDGRRASATAGGRRSDVDRLTRRPVDRALPEPVVAPEPLVQIATTRRISHYDLGNAIVQPQRWCAVAASGDVYCWGYNASGQVGDGTTDHAYDAVVVGLPAPAVAGEDDPDSTCALLTTGEVYCWGTNYYGQLGNGTIRRASLIPQKWCCHEPRANVSPVVTIILGVALGAALRAAEDRARSRARGTRPSRSTPSADAGRSGLPAPVLARRTLGHRHVHRRVVETCRPEHACGGGRCQAPCAAAAADRRSDGCEFFVQPPLYRQQRSRRSLLRHVHRQHVAAARRGLARARRENVDISRSLFRTTPGSATLIPHTGPIAPGESMILFLSDATRRCRGLGRTAITWLPERRDRRGDRRHVRRRHEAARRSA